MEHTVMRNLKNHDWNASHDSSMEERTPRKKRVPLIQRSLAVLVASLQGMQVVIELKNDSEISGVLEEADRGMNLTLLGATQISRHGVVISMEVAFVNGSKIRYVHIPPDINVVRHMAVYMKRVERVVSSNTRHTIRSKGDKDETECQAESKISEDTSSGFRNDRNSQT